MKKYKFITFKKHKRLKKLSHSFISKFRKNKGLKQQKQVDDDNEILKSVSSSSSSEDNEDPITVFKEKCQSLFKEMPESINQPQKIMDYQYAQQNNKNQNAQNDVERDAGQIEKE